MKKMGIFILGMIMMTSATVVFGASIDEMMIVLKDVQAGVSTTLASIDNDLKGAAKKLAAIDLKSDEARGILSDVLKGRDYAYDCAIIGPDGKLSVIEPGAVREYEGKDVSFEASVKEVLERRTSLVSKVFQALDGSYKIDFEYPIINDKGEFLGSVSLLVSHDRLLNEVIAPLTEGRPCRAWVMQTDGVVLYDIDTAQINKNIFTDPVYGSFADLISFSETVVGSPNGAGSYDFYKQGETDKTVVKKDAVWDTVTLHGNEWRIVVVELDEDQPQGSASYTTAKK